VGLAERYVRLLVDGLKVTIMGGKALATDWDLYVDAVVHSINTRVLRVHGFTSAELLLGYNPNRIGWDTTMKTDCAVAITREALAEGHDLWDDGQTLVGRQHDRLARIDEQRALAGEEIILNADERMRNQKTPRFEPPKDGDLVLLLRFILDQRRGSKLEPGWEGPYRFSDLAWYGKSGRLYDINTHELVRVKKGGLKDCLHLNDLKLYLTRPATVEANMLDLLDYGRGEAWEGMGDVFKLGGDICGESGGGGHVKWVNEPQRVG